MWRWTRIVLQVETVTSSSVNSSSLPTSTSRIAARSSATRGLELVRLAQAFIDELLPRLDTLEVAAPASQQRLFKPALDSAVRSLHVAVLLLRADLSRARLHPEVAHHRRYASLNGRFWPSTCATWPDGMSCVADVELSVW